MEQAKIFNHKKYKEFGGIYSVSLSGVVYNTITGNYLNLNMTEDSKQRFVRLCNNGKSISIGINKLILLTYRGEQYKNGLIAISSDGRQTNQALDNLFWGTRQQQALIHVSNPDNFKRISELGQKYGKLNWKNNLVCDGKKLMEWRESNGISKLSEEKIIKIKELYKQKQTVTEIARNLKISRSSVYKYM